MLLLVAFLFHELHKNLQILMKYILHHDHREESLWPPNSFSTSALKFLKAGVFHTSPATDKPKFCCDIIRERYKRTFTTILCRINGLAYIRMNQMQNLLSSQ